MNDLILVALVVAALLVISQGVYWRARKIRRKERDRISDLSQKMFDERLEGGYENLDRNRDLSPDERLRRNDGLH